MAQFAKKHSLQRFTDQLLNSSGIVNKNLWQALPVWPGKRPTILEYKEADKF